MGRFCLSVLLWVVAQGQAALPPGHPPAESAQAAPSMEELLRRLDAQSDLKTRDKPFDVCVSIGKLYFANGRFADAAEFLGQASKKADVLRATYLKLKPATAAKCPESFTNFEDMADKVKKQLAAKQSANAAACAKETLAVLSEVEGLLGKSLFSVGDGKGALAAFERQLALFPEASEARFGRAMVLVDLHGNEVPKLRLAKEELSQFLLVAPNSPLAKEAAEMQAILDEAIKEGGMRVLVAKRAKVAKEKGVTVSAPPVLSEETMRAFQNVEQTPDMLASFEKTLASAEEHLAKGQFQQALDAYKQVMPYQPSNGRVRAGMAWSLVKLNKQPMADRVWSVAVSSNRDSVETLGKTLESKGDAKGAQELRAKLSAP